MAYLLFPALVGLLLELFKRKGFLSLAIRLLGLDRLVHHHRTRWSMDAPGRLELVEIWVTLARGVETGTDCTNTWQSRGSRVE
jgi:hypothetical protein